MQIRDHSNRKYVLYIVRTMYNVPTASFQVSYSHVFRLYLSIKICTEMVRFGKNVVRKNKDLKKIQQPPCVFRILKSVEQINLPISQNMFNFRVIICSCFNPQVFVVYVGFPTLKYEDTRCLHTRNAKVLNNILSVIAYQCHTYQFEY